MKRLIVNADDFGLTPAVNRAIERAHREGVVTSTTLLVTAEAAEDAASAARDLRDLDVGLHVNLTLGAPASEPARVASLLDADGSFVGSRVLFKRLVAGRVNTSDVYREVVAQCVTARRMGVELTHWDPHEAVAFWPVIRGAAAAAAADCGIERVRSPWIAVVERERTPSEARARWRRRRKRRWMTEANRAVGRYRLRQRFLIPDRRLSPNLVEGASTYREQWRIAFANIPPGTSELVSHPGTVDSQLIALTPRLTHDREVDLEILTDPSLRQRLTESGISLIGFRALRA